MFCLEFIISFNNLTVLLHEDIISKTGYVCYRRGNHLLLNAKLIISANTQLTCSQYDTHLSFYSLHTHVGLVFLFIWLLCSCFCPLACQKNERSLEGVSCWPEALLFSISMPLRKLETKLRLAQIYSFRNRGVSQFSAWKVKCSHIHHIFITTTTTICHHVNVR